VRRLAIIAALSFGSACGSDRSARRVFDAPDVLVSGIWGSQANAVWFAGNANGRPTPHIYHFDGTQVREFTLAGIPPSYLHAVWGSSESDVWIAAGEALGTVLDPATQGVLLHYDGKTWSLGYQLDGFGDITGVWGTAHDDVWAVASGGTSTIASDWRGTILHYNGAGWLAMPTENLEPPGFRGVCGFGADDVWMIGVAPSINSKNVHWDGRAFSAPSEAQSAALFCVPGDGVWLVSGDVGTQVSRWNGRDPPVRVDTGGRSVSFIYGSAPNDVWISGTKCTDSGLLGCTNMAWVAAHGSGSGFSNVNFSGFTVPPNQGLQILATFATAEDDVWFSVPFALAHYP
jgi:hypothetical protein